VPSLLEDFLSRDPHRVWTATWATISSRDPAELDPLVDAIPMIRSATDDLDLGGMVRSNRASLEHALGALEHYRAGHCWCATYPGILSINPEKERDRGHVLILSTSEPGWSMTFETACVVCGRRFDVEQGDHHFLWWNWVPRGEERGRAT
jgi:hypothetical protein